MDIQYNFNDLIKIESTVDQTEDPRKGFKIIKCCGNCRFAWFGRGNERRGYCRLGQMEKKPPTRWIPHRDWKHLRTHATGLCSSHVFRAKGYWNEHVRKWLNKIIDMNGEIIGELEKDDAEANNKTT